MATCEQKMEPSTPLINADQFWKRMTLLHNHWQEHLKHIKICGNMRYDTYPNPYPGWNECDSILILCGKNDYAYGYKNNALHIWLTGYELLSSVIIITKDKIHVCAGNAVTEFLTQLPQNNSQNKHILNIKFIQKQKHSTDGYSSNFKELSSILKSSGKKIGVIQESIKGFAAKFMTSITDSNEFKIVSFSQALSNILMIKDNSEILSMKQISQFTSQALIHSQTIIEQLLAKNQSKTHVKISEELIKIIDEPRILNSNLATDCLDVVYDPIIQSGGKYKLSYTVESSNQKLHYDYGTIVIMMAFTLNGYCSNIGRTFLVDATSEQREIYAILLEVYNEGLATLRDNVVLSEVYNICVSKIKKSRRPYLKRYFRKSVGWGTGLLFRDNIHVLGYNKQYKLCKTGMVFNFQVGFENLIDKTKEANGLEKAKKYSLFIADTVLITEKGAEILTNVDRNYFEYHIDTGIGDCTRLHDVIILWVDLLVDGYCKHIEIEFDLWCPIPKEIKRLIGLFCLRKRICKP